ncbi:MAG: hypothetical protein RPU42_04155 [Candidatus Sedimenticola sp. (ex Thyasira tokunagai)]
MQNIITATVIGAKRYIIDGDKSATIFVQQPTDPDNENAVGLEVMKISSPFEILDVLKKHTLPGEFMIETKLTSAAGGKIGMKCTGIKPVKSPAVAASK